jgi:hypothetical protein
LQDGTQLAELSNETVSQPNQTVYGKDAPTLRMNEAELLGMKEEETVENKRIVAPTPTRSGNPILTIGVVIIALCLMALVGIGFVFLAKDYLFANQNKAEINNNANISINANVPSNRNANKPNINANTSNPTSSITATASSTRAPYKDIIYSPSFLVDGNLATAWIEGVRGEGVGQWVRFDFGRAVTLKKIVVYPGYFKNESIWAKNNRLAAATFYFSNGSSQHFSFDDHMEPQTVDVGKVKTTYVKLVIDDFYPGTTDSEDTAISELNFVFE